MNRASSPAADAFAAFRAPPAPPTPGGPPVPGLTDFEQDSKNFTLSTGLNAITQAGTAIYSFKRRWRAVEVFMSIPTTLWAGATWESSMGVQLFAVVAGQRALVASGRFSAAEWTNNAVRTKRLIAYEGLAANFETELSWRKMQTVVTGSFVQIACFGSDQGGSAPDEPNVGVISGTTDDTMFSTQASRNILAESPLQLVGAHAVASVAGRWLQFFDATGGVNVGDKPLFSFGVPTDAVATSTGPNPFIDQRLLRVRRFHAGIFPKVSSAGTTFQSAGVADGDVAFNFYYR